MYSDERTPVEAIAVWLGLQVETFHPDSYPRGTYGFMDADEDERLVWLCRDLSETLRRFTLAHELGHAVLHCLGGERIQAILRQLHNEISDATTVPELSRRDPCQSDDVQEEMTALFEQEQIEEMLGHDTSGKYDPRSQREIAANLFAAELLMPSTRVAALYLAQQVRPHTLADLFGVSQAAMLNRLTELLKVSATRACIPPHSNAPTPSSYSGTPTGAVNTLVSPPHTQYDQFQQAAIEAATPALITAGPGSGKTSTLIGRVAYLISTLGIAPHTILALTFSRKAAQEMEERLAQIVHGDSLPRVSTFHAFCADLLRRYATLVGLRPDFLLLDEVEGYFLLRQLANNFYLRHYQTLHAPAYYFPDILKAISRAKDELASPAQYAYLAQQMQAQASSEEAVQQAEKALEVAYVYKLYEEALQQRGDTDFGGLLVLAVQLLREHPEVLQEQQQRYQHVLVDEFQDMNRASGVLLRELAGAERRVWVVGDANQAIYGFRGASPANISQFEQDYPGAVVLPLSRNYRSHPDLVALAESFRCTQLELGQVPGKNQPVRLPQPDVCVTVAQATNEVGELGGILQDVHHKHAHGYAYRDMVVLCRTRAQVQKVSYALATDGLPVVERSSMLEQEYIKNALAIVLLLADARGMGLLRAARQPEHSLSQRDIEALLLAARERATTPVGLLLHGELPLDLSIQGRASLTRLIEILQALHWASDMWSLLAHYLLLDTSRVRDLLRCPEDKEAHSALADYNALLQLARRYDQQQRRNYSRGDPLRSPWPLHEQARDFLEYLSLLVMLRQDGGNRQQDTAESAREQADVIRVMTVHASKGLEFPVVYLPFLVQRRFPLQQRANPVPAPLGMLPAESESAKAHDSGESCLFYVGVTRARDALILSYSERYGKLSYKRSPYLDALEAGIADQRITKLHWDVGARFIAPRFIAPRFIAPTVPEPNIVGSTQPSEGFVEAMRASKTVSVSDVEAYQRCPRQYAYRHIYHFQSEEGAYQLFWRATQDTIADVSKRLQASKESQAAPTQQAVRELYDQHWQELFGASTLPFAALYQQHGHEIVESIRRDLCTGEDVKWELRQDYTVDIAGQAVQVSIDRVEASTPVKFIRTRYGKRKEKPVADTREMLYARAYRQAHPDQPVELHSHNLSTGETMPITMTPKKEQCLYDEVEQALLGMQRNAYPAQPAEPFRCPTCPFFFICPA
jgi:superfamily I DNA/RNA helicase/Zn-dependent peptidase ImmA (M78 family)/CRISPR/Cas system-associated exonuclease Cas4 (RecB family)